MVTAGREAGGGVGRQERPGRMAAPGAASVTTAGAAAEAAAEAAPTTEEEGSPSGGWRGWNYFTVAPDL